MSDFVSAVLSVDGKVGDLTWLGALFGYPEFTQIYENPKVYVDDALQAMRRRDLSEQQKMIAALSMQRLDLRAFVAFAKQVLAMMNEGQVTEPVFRQAVFPTYEWNTKLVENHADATVQDLLSSVMASDQVGDTIKSYVAQQVLTGKARQHVLDLREAGQLR